MKKISIDADIVTLMRELPPQEFKTCFIAIIDMDKGVERPGGIAGAIFDIAAKKYELSVKRAKAARTRMEKKGSSEHKRDAERDSCRLEKQRGEKVHGTASKKQDHNPNGKEDDHVAMMSEVVIEYLNRKAGTSYRSKSKDTRSHISARMREGMTEKDFFTVVDKKVIEWKDDAKMRGFLRPSTLFGTKMEQYLGQATARRQETKFDNFQPRSYDMADIERKLIGG